MVVTGGFSEHRENGADEPRVGGRAAKEECLCVGYSSDGSVHRQVGIPMCDAEQGGQK